MKSVISYRTENFEELKKIAKIRNVSMSTISEEIVKEYLDKQKIKDKFDMFNNGKKFISSTFEHLDNSVFDKMASIGAAEFTRSIKMSMNNFSLENLLIFIKKWMDLNKLQLGEFDENERIRWVCETKMGKNYNEICAKCFKKILENFGFICNIELVTMDYFEIIFLKYKRS